MNEADHFWNRRQFLKTGFGALTGIVLAGRRPTAWSALSTGTVREYRFRAYPSEISLGTGPSFKAWTYNGRVPGPEIRVREGEIIRVILKNELPDGTTIHWHGLPVPNPMDGVPGVTQPPVAPGNTFIYEFEARPAGTFIYHSHFGYQLDQGLYGSLIIEPSREERSYDREYSLVLEDWVMRDGGGVAETRRRPPMGMGMMGRGMMRRFGAPRGDVPLLEPYYDAYAINGKVYPAVDPIFVKKGDRVRLRLANASSATIYDLRLAGHSLVITHADGNPVRPIMTDVLRIGMGERYDVEFIADNPGRWLLAAYENGLGESGLRVPVVYHGVNNRQPTPPTFPQGLRYVGFWDLTALNRDSGPGETPNRRYRQVLSGGMHSPYWTINGQVYPSSETLLVRAGEKVQLAYFNQSMMPHPMHLHGHFFRVVNPNLPPDLWIKKDTIIVDRMQRVEIEFLADNPGNWFHHCHNLYHMEAGMANVLAYKV